MKLTDGDLQMLMRLRTIKRWQIVEMGRQQSVAEHSFMVWALTIHLWDYMFPLEHNSFERDSAQSWALVHDTAETKTGDIPTPTKRTLDSLSPGICKRLEEHVLQENAPGIAETWRGIQGSIAEVIVDIADTVEALLYLSSHSRDARFCEIYDKLSQSIEDRIAKAAIKFPGAPWDRARAWARKRLGHSMDLEGPPQS